MSNLKMTFQDLADLIPASTQESYDWDAFVELIPALAAQEAALGDAVYHAEGSVGVHTRMCLDAMMVDPLFEAGSVDDRFVLFVAMLLHDVAKPDTEVVDPDTGRVGNPGHSKRGAVDTRILLWKAGVPFDLLFADDHTRTAYFRGAQVSSDFALFKEPGSVVTVMSGLPASGKDTWVQANRKGLPVVSFDDAKAELGLKSAVRGIASSSRGATSRSIRFAATRPSMRTAIDGH